MGMILDIHRITGLVPFLLDFLSDMWFFFFIAFDRFSMNEPGFSPGKVKAIIF